MAKNDSKSAVNFQSESGTVDFQPEQGGGQNAEQSGSRLSEMTENVNWNKVGLGVGAAAAVAGAAYAAKKFIGRDAAESGKDSSGGGGGKRRS